MKSLCIFIILVGVVFSNAQVREPVRTTQEIDRDNTRDSRRGDNRSGNNSSGNIFLNSIQPLYRKPSKKELELLAPDQSDQNKYADFLKQSKTGITKLIASVDCPTNTAVVSATPECLIYSMPGSGASYSFRTDSYRINRLADLTISNETFLATGTLINGLMVSLGDVAIEQVSLTTKGVEFLNEFEPPTDYAKAAETAQLLQDGIEKNGFTYKNVLSVEENTTYVLRSIAYRGNAPRTVQGVTYDEFDYDKREDIFVAFRVIREDNDGNITIVWKELKNQKSPKLKK